MDDDGNYFKSAPDVAYSFALLELSGEKHYKFLPKTYYVYNADSPYNEHKPNKARMILACNMRTPTHTQNQSNSCNLSTQN